MHNYHDTYLRFALQQTCCHGSTVAEPRIRSSWTVRVLPYIEQQVIYDQLSFGRDIGLSGIDLTLKQEYLPAVMCPSDPDASQRNQNGADDAGGVQLAKTNYAISGGGHPNGSSTTPGVGGAGYAQYGSPISQASQVRGVSSRTGYTARIGDITDGTANTILLGEVIGAWCMWQDWGYPKLGHDAHPINYWNWEKGAMYGNPDHCIGFRSRHAGRALWAC